MRIFVTGATGLIGSAVVGELLASGHQVLGLARSVASAQALDRLGIAVQRGDLTDLESLRRGAAASDGVIHTGYIHDFSRVEEAVLIDREALSAMGEVLAGSGRPLLFSSGTATLTPGRPTTEGDAGDPKIGRIATEHLALNFAEKKVRAVSVRMPITVHGEGDRAFIPAIIDVARKKKLSAYVGDGGQRWAAVHFSDAARLFLLALERGTAGARYHAVGDEGVPFRQIAEAIGKQLGVPVASQSPEEAVKHFGFLGALANMDIPAVSTKTQQLLGWSPKGPSLLQDLAMPFYAEGMSYIPTPA